MMTIDSWTAANRPYPRAGPELAAEVTRMWADQFQTPMPFIVGPTFVAANITFYSVDHPLLFTNANLRIATWINLAVVRQSGYVGVCPSGSKACIAEIRSIGNPARETEILVRHSPSTPV